MYGRYRGDPRLEHDLLDTERRRCAGQLAAGVDGARDAGALEERGVSRDAVEHAQRQQRLPLRHVRRVQEEAASASGHSRVLGRYGGARGGERAGAGAEGVRAGACVGEAPLGFGAECQQRDDKLHPGPTSVSPSRQEGAWGWGADAGLY